MKITRLGVVIIITLISSASSYSQTQRSSRSSTVSVRHDGLEIQLNRQDLRRGLTTRGSQGIAQRTIDAIQNFRRASYNIDRNRLGRQIQMHAVANTAAPLIPSALLPLRREVRRRANPVNVTWPEIRRRN